MLHIPPNTGNYPDIDEERKELIDEGIIFDNGNELIFLESYMVNSQVRGYTALSAAALTLYGSRNGWEYWRDWEGNFLKENEEISSFLIN